MFDDSKSLLKKKDNDDEIPERPNAIKELLSKKKSTSEDSESKPILPIKNIEISESEFKIDAIKSDPSLKSGISMESSISETPGSEITNLKMNSTGNINNTSSLGVIDESNRNASLIIANSESNKQNNTSNVQTSVTKEQKQSNSKNDNVPNNFDTSDITKNIDNVRKSVTSYLYYFIGIILLIVIVIVIFIVIFMFMNKKPKKIITYKKLR